MAFASTSKSRAAYVAETVFGTTPATPAFKNIRRTRGGLATRKGTEVSGEIQADRNVRDEYQLSQDVAGSYDFELSYGSFDDLLAGALMGAWATDVLVNGTLQPSFTFEEMVDIGGTSKYFRYAGVSVSTLALNFASRASVKGTINLMGQKEIVDDAIVTGATYTTANTKPIACAHNVAALTVAGLTTQPIIKSLSLNIANNLRVRDAVGTLYTAEFGVGQCDVTGSLEAYFSDGELYQKVLDHGSAAISFTVGATTAEKYTFNLPKCVFLDGNKTLGDKNSDVMVTIPFRAVYDATTAGSIKITRAVA